MSSVREEILVSGSDALKKAKRDGLILSDAASALGPFGSMKFDFPDSLNDPRCARVKAWLVDSGFRHTSIVTNLYDREELEQAEWVCVGSRIGDVLESDAFDRKVIPGACRMCGALNQYSGFAKPLVPPAEGCALVCTSVGEWLIRRDVCADLEADLIPISGRDWAGWGEIRLESTSWWLHESSTGLVCETPCPNCGREGHFFDYSKIPRLVYQGVDSIESESGFSGSRELIANSLFNEYGCYRARPLLYVPGSVAVEIRDQSHLMFTIVEFIE